MQTISYDLELPDFVALPGSSIRHELGDFGALVGDAVRLLFLFPHRGPLELPGAARLLPDDPRIWVLSPGVEDKIVDAQSYEYAVTLPKGYVAKASELDSPEIIRGITEQFDKTLAEQMLRPWRLRSPDPQTAEYQTFFFLLDYATRPDYFYKEDDAPSRVDQEEPGLATWLKNAAAIRQAHDVGVQQIEWMACILRQVRDRRVQYAKYQRPLDYQYGRAAAEFSDCNSNSGGYPLDFWEVLGNVSALLEAVFSHAPENTDDRILGRHRAAVRLALPFLWFSEGRLRIAELGREPLNCKPDSVDYFLFAEVALAAHRCLGEQSSPSQPRREPFNWLEIYTLFVSLQDAFVRWHGFPHSEDRNRSKYASIRTSCAGPYGDFHFLAGWQSRVEMWRDTGAEVTRWSELHGASLLAAFWSETAAFINGNRPFP